MAERLVSRDPNRVGQISRVVYTRIETRGSRAAAGVLAWRMLFQRRSLGIRLDPGPGPQGDTDGRRCWGEGSPAGILFRTRRGGDPFFTQGEKQIPRRRGDPRDRRSPVRTLWRTGVRVQSALPNATGLDRPRDLRPLRALGARYFHGGLGHNFLLYRRPTNLVTHRRSGAGRDTFDRVQCRRSDARNPDFGPLTTGLWTDHGTGHVVSPRNPGRFWPLAPAREAASVGGRLGRRVERGWPVDRWVGTLCFTR